MECNDVILSRYSVRKFLPDPVPQFVLTEMLEAARLAPSTQNKQPWRFIVLQKSGQDKINGF